MEAATFDRRRLHRRAMRLEVFTLAWNCAEAAVAVFAGFAAGSVALVTFGLDSAIEVTAASAVLWRLKTAGPGAQASERRNAERDALYVVGNTFVILAAYVLGESLWTLLHEDAPENSTVGLVLAAFSLAVMPALAALKQRTGTALDSPALVADAAETWVCSSLSLALLAGVGLHALFAWWWADPVAALLMLPVIGWQTVETFGEARERGGRS